MIAREGMNLLVVESHRDARERGTAVVAANDDVPDVRPHVGEDHARSPGIDHRKRTADRGRTHARPAHAPAPAAVVADPQLAARGVDPIADDRIKGDRRHAEHRRPRRGRRPHRTAVRTPADRTGQLERDGADRWRRSRPPAELPHRGIRSGRSASRDPTGDHPDCASARAARKDRPDTATTIRRRRTRGTHHSNRARSAPWLQAHRRRARREARSRTHRPSPCSSSILRHCSARLR